MYFYDRKKLIEIGSQSTGRSESASGREEGSAGETHWGRLWLVVKNVSLQQQNH